MTANAVTVSGHRGAVGVTKVPENTIAAFSYAVAAGASAVEFDVRWTRDGRMVVLHDNTLDRTTRCRGSVEKITYAALRKCASAKAVPTFAAALAYARDHRLTVNPELKPVPGHPLTRHQAHEYVERIADHAMTRRAVVSSSSTAVLDLVKRQPESRGLRYALITGRKGAVSPFKARAVGSVYMPDYRTLTRSSVKAYRTAGVRIWAWPAATPADIEAMVILGVDVVVADDPRVAAKVLAR